jgi:hypothetical protein
VNRSFLPAIGDEYEFNIDLDNRGEENAVRITVLPRGTVRINDERRLGVVLEKPLLLLPSSQTTNTTSSDSTGIIQLLPHDVVSSAEAADPKDPSPRFRHRNSLSADQKQLSPIARKLTQSSQAKPGDYLNVPQKQLIGSQQHHQRGTSWSTGLPSHSGVTFSHLARFSAANLPAADIFLRRGDFVYLCATPAPKYQIGSHIELVPKIARIEVVPRAQRPGTLVVDRNAFAPSEHLDFGLEVVAADLQERLHEGMQVQISQITMGDRTSGRRRAGLVEKVDSANPFGLLTVRALPMSTGPDGWEESIAVNHRTSDHFWKPGSDVSSSSRSPSPLDKSMGDWRSSDRLSMW